LPIFLFSRFQQRYRTFYKKLLLRMSEHGVIETQTTYVICTITCISHIHRKFVPPKFSSKLGLCASVICFSDIRSKFRYFLPPLNNFWFRRKALFNNPQFRRIALLNNKRRGYFQIVVSYFSKASSSPVWASFFSSLLGRTRSQGRCWAANRLSTSRTVRSMQSVGTGTLESGGMTEAFTSWGNGVCGAIL